MIPLPINSEDNGFNNVHVNLNLALDSTNNSFDICIHF